MLTHTYLLQNVLERAKIEKYDYDIFVYNIIPDLLTIHPNINSQQTHQIKRLFSSYPPQYPKSAYVMFHLLVDDLAHYGSMCSDIPAQFNPDSRGYSYLKGKPIISSILDFHKKVNREISYNEAVYRSHLIVEMIYDLVIYDQIDTRQSINLLADAVSTTADNYMEEFITTINWLYGFCEEDIRDVVKKAAVYLTAERMHKIMSVEGRVRLYAYKFGLRNDNQSYFGGIKDLFLQAMDLLDDDEMFLRETNKAVSDYGWLPPVR